jgi:hypothetical protein
MKRLLSVLMGFALLLLSSTNGWSLPTCPGSPVSSRYETRSWTDCLGTHTYADEYKYVGEWKDGKRNGQGTYYYLADNQFKGDKYVGEFKYGKYYGQGTLTYANGDKYVGEFSNKPNGQGTYTYAEGHKYVGEFRDDKPNGQGIRYNADGTVYQEGIFENGKFLSAKKPSPTVTAKKTLTKRSILPPCPGSPTSRRGDTRSWTDCLGIFDRGYRYVGEWKDGKQHGQGTFFRGYRKIYVGQWKNGKKHGHGTHYSLEVDIRGHKYVGEFKDGIRNGQGTLTWTNGNKYVGEFKDGKPNGRGTFTIAKSEE